MAHVLLFHSILGLRPVEREITATWQADGHTVLLPDLFGGQTAESYEEGFALKDDIGDDLIQTRACDALDDVPDTAVLAGVSFGAFLVGQLAHTKPNMAGALLFAGVAPWSEPPKSGLPVQAHIAQPDPFDDEDFFKGWLAAEETSCEMFRYQGVGHYFLDRTLPDYNEDASSLALKRARTFLSAL